MAFLLAAGFMTMLDVSIVNVALPNLQDSLHANDSELEWVVASYILAHALGLLPFGRLGDVWGRKRTFIVGVAGFTAASALCGVAPSAAMLVTARVIQGLAAAAISPQIMAIAVTLFQPRERARAFSTFGLVGGVASILGAVVGGALIVANFDGLGWRLCFLINIPIGLVTIAGAMVYLPDIAPHPGLRNDFGGIGLAVIAVVCLIFPLVEGRGHGWPLWCVGMLALSLPLFAAFVGWERRQERSRRPLLFPIYLMANRDYLAGGAAIAALFAVLQGFFLIISIVLQQGLLYSPLRAGVAMTSFSMGMAIATFLSGRIVQLRPKVVTGAVVLGLSFAAQWLLVAHDTSAPQYFVLLAVLLLGGTGSGLTISSLFQGVTRTVPIKDMGAASGSLQALQQIGGALGVAVASQLFYATIVDKTRGGLAVAAATTEGLQAAVQFFVPTCVLVIALALLMPFRAPDRVTS